MATQFFFYYIIITTLQISYIGDLFSIKIPSHSHAYKLHLCHPLYQMIQHVAMKKWKDDVQSNSPWDHNHTPY